MRRLSNLFLTCFCLFFIVACGDSGNNSVPVRSSNTNVTAVQTYPGEGLDLGAVSELAKTANNAEHLEQLINESDANNLDVDGDGNIEYIQVMSGEADGNQRTFTLFVQTGDGEDGIQEIASITYELQADGSYGVQMYGNEYIYGPNHYVNYRYRPSMGTYLFLRWLYAPTYRPYYVRRSWGYRPSYYVRRSFVPMSTYRSRSIVTRSTKTYTRTKTSKITTRKKSKIAGKSSKSIKKRAKQRGSNRKLSNANKGRQQFKKNTNNKGQKIGGSGFANKSKKKTGIQKNKKLSNATKGRSQFKKNTRNKGQKIGGSGFAKKSKIRSKPKSRPRKTVFRNKSGRNKPTRSRSRSRSRSRRR